MRTSTELEMRGINAWNDVYAIIGKRRDVPCQLPNFSIVTLEDCLAWLPSSAYGDFTLSAITNSFVSPRLSDFALNSSRPEWPPRTSVRLCDRRGTEIPPAGADRRPTAAHRSPCC